MIEQSAITAAVGTLARGAHVERICSVRARGATRADSDVEVLVIESEVENRAAEMVRLRRLLRPLCIPLHGVVYSCDEVERWGDQPGSALYWAQREGSALCGRGADRAASAAVGAKRRRCRMRIVSTSWARTRSICATACPM